MGDAEPRATELIISKKSELRNLGSEASVQDIEQSLEAWGQFIERYQAPEDDTQKTQLLDFWETSLTSEQYRWIQITALRHNYADALMSEKLKDVFVESSSKLELIPFAILLSKYGGELDEDLLLAKYKATEDPELKRILGQSRSWLKYNRAMKENPDLGKDDPFSASKQLSPGPSFPTPQIDLEALVTLYTQDIGSTEPAVEIIEEPIVEVTPAPPVEEVAEVPEEVTAPEPTTEEPVEVVVAEPTEKPTEQSSNWFFWLIGALVILGGLFLVVRRKS